MNTNQLGHCHQTDPFDQNATPRDIGTITIVSNTIELGYMHGMACHLRSKTTSWLWQLGTYCVNGPEGGPGFQVRAYPAGMGANKLRRPREATLPSAGPRGRACSVARAPEVAHAASGKDTTKVSRRPKTLKGYIALPRQGQHQGPLLGAQVGMQHTTVYCLSTLTTGRLLS